ncbi:hypothetical protein H5410_003581 [Solanum commersonii]|uniref:Uncharacterized protein n=1 Tax=Solanum commersonii TaxID=4109 RepID=A0A9J6B5F0_SOLCO|nr:hypothetical protein H5410_003581 [Solanum commersonii]
MPGSTVYPKIQVVTHHYQRFSLSQYLLQMQVQAHQKYSNALTQRMIPYSHTMLTQDQKVFSSLVMGLSAKSQRDAKSSHIVYATLFGVIVAVHSWSFDYEHYPSHRGSLGTVSQDCRYTRQSTFSSISLPSCFSLQSFRAMSHWAILYCFAQLLGSTPTAPFHC